MKPRKIQSPAGAFMPFLLVLSGFFLLTSRPVKAQCPTGSSVQSLNYTQTFTGIGTANYPFTMPQFNPSPGGYTLFAAVLTSHATTTNTISFTNTTSSEQDFPPQLSRTDNIRLNNVNVYGGWGYYNDYPYTMLDASGTPTDNITYGPDQVFNNTKIFSDSIYDPTTLTSKYQGSGNLALTYYSTFYVNNVQLGVTSVPNISDNITFSLTYYFCNPTVLSSNILTFTAERRGSQNVDLNWMTTNEEPGRRYYIEVSSSGQEFAVAGSVPANASSNEASYTWAYSIPPAATGKLYFRLKQVAIDGTASWSDVRTINLDGTGSGSAFSIYPNPPSDFINLTMPGDIQDWQVDIVAADGSLVQRNYYRNSNTAKVSFVRRLAAGTYFVRAVNPQTGKSYSGSFLMR